METVNHPGHYCDGRKFEPKDVIRDWNLNFNLGSAVKYIARAGRKDNTIEDLEKARKYLEYEIEAMEDEDDQTSGSSGEDNAFGEYDESLAEIGARLAKGFAEVGRRWGAVQINVHRGMCKAESERTMKFGEAITALKAGEKVCRKGWNGKGIFLELQRPDEHSKMTLPYIYIVTSSLITDNPDAPKGVVPWLASQTDILSEDWIIYEGANDEREN